MILPWLWLHTAACQLNPARSYRLIMIGNERNDTLYVYICEGMRYDEKRRGLSWFITAVIGRSRWPLPSKQITSPLPVNVFSIMRFNCSRRASSSLQMSSTSFNGIQCNGSTEYIVFWARNKHEEQDAKLSISEGEEVIWTRKKLKKKL